MPRIKNWKKKDDKLYQYRPNSQISVRIVNNKEGFFDKRLSNWCGEILYEGLVIEELFSNNDSFQEGRDAFISWMKNNPTVDKPRLKKEYQAQMRGTDADKIHTMPDNPCVNFDYCGNSTPSESNHICTQCLDEARWNDSSYRQPQYAP